MSRDGAQFEEADTAIEIVEGKNSTFRILNRLSRYKVIRRQYADGTWKVYTGSRAKRLLSMLRKKGHAEF